jgi:hypothetical protein
MHAPLYFEFEQINPKYGNFLIPKKYTKGTQNIKPLLLFSIKELSTCNLYMIKLVLSEQNLNFSIRGRK